ncbi:MAG: hypothetical protein SPE06_11585, partial [[Actinobacillus] rossii]|nr:hypothetical protein [[Actinobacillus] rossii]
LYKINPEAPNGYLVETDSRFTDRKQWLSSDYMFNALRHDHNYVQKRLRFFCFRLLQSIENECRLRQRY